MGKRTTGKKRGILRGVAKYKIKSKKLTQQDDWKTIFGLEKSMYSALGAKCFQIIVKGSFFFYLVPFRRTAGGEYVRLENWKQKVRHYAALCVGFASALHKVLGAAEVLLFQELSVESFMVISVVLIYSVTILLSVAVLARPEETMDLLNSWPRILACIQEILEGPTLSPFDDVSTSLKVIAIFLVSQGVVIAALLLSIVMGHLPVFWLPLADRLGLIPEGIMPRFGWQLLFLPLEYLTYLPPMFIAPFSGGIMVVLVGVLKLYLRELR